jgi:beta-mannanase
VTRFARLLLVAVVLVVPTAPVAEASTSSVGAIKLCAYAKPRGKQTLISAVAKFEKKIGRKLDMAHHYYHWGWDFPGKKEAVDKAKGRIPYVSWRAETDYGKAITWASIASGARDKTIRRRANDVRAFGKPIYLAFHQEPEDDRRTGGAAAFVAAYRHVRRVFDIRGATNVRWVVILMGSTYASGRAPYWYPGNAFVDYVGTDAYNWYPGRRGFRWRSFKEIMAPVYRFATARGKPMMVGETGVQEHPNGALAKRKWFLRALKTMKSWPNLKVLCYFHSDRIYPWWIHSTKRALSGFRAMARSPYVWG